MNNKIEEYIKNRKFAEELVDKAMSDSDMSVSQEFADFMASEQRHIMIEKLRNSEAAQERYVNIEARDRSGDVDRLSHRIRKVAERQRRKTLIIKVTISTVAAALLALSFNIYVQLSGNETVAENIEVGQDAPKTKRVEPADIVPILVYENGTSEKLSSRRTISIDGSDIAVTKDDRIEYSASHADSVVYGTLMTPYKSCYTVVLADGTEVFLSGNSKLRYPSKFIGDERVVELDGEGFFNVTKSDIPFKVKVDDIEVNVYGTEFSVNNKRLNQVITTLLTGSVGVKYSHHAGQSNYRITPGQRISVNPESGGYSIESNVNIERYRAWLNGYFRFDGEKLGDLLDAVSDWYGVTFDYEYNYQANKLISASLDRNLSIDNVLRLIEISSDVEFTKKGGTNYIVR